MPKKDCSPKDATRKTGRSPGAKEATKLVQAHTGPDLEERLASNDCSVGVVGLGYVGLPLAVAFAEAGISVLGFDILPHRVRAVNEGESYIPDVSTGRLRAVVHGGRLQATTDQSRLNEPDAICICVPTPLTKAREPELSYVIRESEEIAQRLRSGQLVVLESTTYPGTTEEVVLPILLRSHLVPGTDFFVAYSPERVDPGNGGTFTIRNTPKIVGGIDGQSTRLAAALYSRVADRIIEVASPRTAEMAKIFENVFRAVNIALVNELAQLCEKMKLSVWDVIAAAATKPFGFLPFWPGPGVGGHCIPLDPYYLASKAREYDFHTRFIELAGTINEEMPYYVAQRVVEALNSQEKSVRGSRILILGIAYKRDIGDVRESPALKLFGILRSWGADISYHDPYVREIQVEQERFASRPLEASELAASDCVVIAVDHRCVDYSTVVAHSSLVFDTRGVTTNMRGANISRL